MYFYKLYKVNNINNYILQNIIIQLLYQTLDLEIVKKSNELYLPFSK